MIDAITPTHTHTDTGNGHMLFMNDTNNFHHISIRECNPNNIMSRIEAPAAMIWILLKSLFVRLFITKCERVKDDRNYAVTDFTFHSSLSPYLHPLSFSLFRSFCFGFFFLDYVK